jgi:hypothetical protein
MEVEVGYSVPLAGRNANYTRGCTDHAITVELKALADLRRKSQRTE